MIENKTATTHRPDEYVTIVTDSTGSKRTPPSVLSTFPATGSPKKRCVIMKPPPKKRAIHIVSVQARDPYPTDLTVVTENKAVSTHTDDTITTHATGSKRASPERPVVALRCRPRMMQPPAKKNRIHTTSEDANDETASTNRVDTDNCTVLNFANLVFMPASLWRLTSTLFRDPWKLECLLPDNMRWISHTTSNQSSVRVMTRQNSGSLCTPRCEMCGRRTGCPSVGLGYRKRGCRCVGSGCVRS